jgi:tetratricopeptide (TPR) repeat protein
VLERVRQEFQQRAAASLSEPSVKRGPANFGDVFADALVFPVGVSDQEQARECVLEGVETYFEESWIHRPLRALGGVPPVDAGHGELKKKLLGVVQFLQDCATGNIRAYDFDRLRRKLGLLPGAGTATGEPDIRSMSAAELAALKPETLSEEQLEQAYQAATKLDARELAVHFAGALVTRPARADRPDRYPWYSSLVQASLADGKYESALNYLNEGEKADCEQNEGRRRNDYELRRGQILAKSGQADSARDVFQRLIERAPAELRYRGSAAEAMLSAKQGAIALQFAEHGLSKAREKNDRDSEQYFMELVAAARKQVG